MINKNMKKLLLLIAISFLLIGIVSATSTNDTISKTNKIVKENKDINTTTIQNINKKSLNKDNIKTATTKKKTKMSLTLNQSKAILNDKVKIIVTLKDNQNKFLKNQNISVKIGTKTYKRTTNSKGKVILNYKITNSNVLGKNITATYYGNKNYSTSKATKLLKSNETGIFTTKMKTVMTNLEKIDELMDSIEDKTFNNFEKDYKSTMQTINSSINLVNKAITISNGLTKYITDKNRKTLLTLVKNDLKEGKSVIIYTRDFYKEIKSFNDGKISESTFNSRYKSFESKINKTLQNIDVIEDKIEKLYKKYPYVIKGLEKYFSD